MAKQIPVIVLPTRNFQKKAADENDIVFIVRGTDLADVRQENLTMSDSLVSVTWSLTLLDGDESQITLSATHDDVAGPLTPDESKSGEGYGTKGVAALADDDPLPGLITITITDPNTAGGAGPVVVSVSIAVVYGS